MESKFINRYRSFCKSLDNLERSKRANPDEDFVIEATARMYNLSFDLSWKVMKDILVKEMGILDFAVGSPRETLQTAFQNGMIDDDEWLKMLKVRNNLAHDYDGAFAAAQFHNIIGSFFDRFIEFRDTVSGHYDTNRNMDGFSDEA